MKVAIMQPYFFPYIGYFQLIHSVDAFVIYDDVNYIKGGWINRNYILSQSIRKIITLRLIGASQNKLINEIEICENQKKSYKTIQQNYSKTKNYSDTMGVIDNVYKKTDNNLARYLDFAIKEVCNYLELKAIWLTSSQIKKDNSLKGQEKVLEICRILGATQYINLPGGRHLYKPEYFAHHGIQLSFLQPNITPYNQDTSKFERNLSIIDVMMRNNQRECMKMLKEYIVV